MNTFVQGTIVEQEGLYGLYYELKLRLSTGQIFPLNYNNARDPRKDVGNKEEKTTADPISDLLELGASYEFLTALELHHLTYTPLVPPGTIFNLKTKEFPGGSHIIRRNDILQGKILDPNWNVANMDYLAVSATANIYKKHYVLLETAVGKVLLNYRDVQFDLGEQADQLAPGGYLEWKSGGLKLLAIIARQPPKAEDDPFSGFDRDVQATKHASQDEEDTFQGFDVPEDDDEK